MKRMRYLIAPLIAVACAGFLFYYLSETLLLWRALLSAVLLFSAFILIDGFLRFE